MERKYLQINSLYDVNFQEILNDYIENFTKRYLIIETNYKKVPNIDIRFDKRDIHHLLGLHKVQDSNINATNTLSKILEGTLTINSIKKHHQFDEIKNRLLNYNFLHHCFINQSVKLCIIVKNKPNPQQLDVIFIDKYNNKNVLLGFKKARGRNYYVPSTMYEVNNSSVYLRKARSNIKTITWHDY